MQVDDIGVSRPDLRGGVRHLNTPRHLIEVDHAVYRREIEGLKRLLPKSGLAIELNNCCDCAYRQQNEQKASMVWST